jgi:hypothetical protein
LHGFWQMLPNFNPYTQSSEHGQDLVAQAQDHFDGNAKGKEMTGCVARGGGEGRGDKDHDMDGDREPSDDKGPLTMPQAPLSSISHQNEHAGSVRSFSSQQSASVT